MNNPREKTDAAFVRLVRLVRAGAGYWRYILPVSLVAAILLARAIGLDDLLAGLLESLERLGTLGILVLGLIYVLATLLMLPGIVLTLAAGFLAAAAWPDHPVIALLLGVATVSLASTTGATLAFLVGKTIARDWVAERVSSNDKLAAVDQAIGENAFKTVLLLRFSPLIPFGMLNYALGVTRAPVGPYVLASWLGMLPATVAYVYMGMGAGKLAALLTGQIAPSPLQAALFIVGLIATLTALLVVVRASRRALRTLEKEARRGPVPSNEA